MNYYTKSSLPSLGVAKQGILVENRFRSYVRGFSTQANYYSTADKVASAPKYFNFPPARTAAKIFYFPMHPLGGFFHRLFSFFARRQRLQIEIHEFRDSTTKSYYIYNKKAHADTDAGKGTVQKHCFRGPRLCSASQSEHFTGM